MTEASYQRLLNRIMTLEHELTAQAARSHELLRRLRELRVRHQELVLEASQAYSYPCNRTTIG